LFNVGSGLDPEDRGILDMIILGEPEDGPSSSLANKLENITESDLNTTISIGPLTYRLVELGIYNILANELTANTTFLS
jgi:hypothetical protein